MNLFFIDINGMDSKMSIDFDYAPANCLTYGIIFKFDKTQVFFRISMRETRRSMSYVSEENSTPNFLKNQREGYGFEITE